MKNLSLLLFLFFAGPVFSQNLSQKTLDEAFNEVLTDEEIKVYVLAFLDTFDDRISDAQTISKAIAFDINEDIRLGLGTSGLCRDNKKIPTAECRRIILRKVNDPQYVSSRMLRDVLGFRTAKLRTTKERR